MVVCLIGDDLVYTIACQAAQDDNLGGGVVGTVMSNMGLENALKAKGIEFARSKVGDRYVMELLQQKKRLDYWRRKFGPCIKP